MLELNTDMVGEKFKKTLICIDEYDQDWKGRIYHSILKRDLFFLNIVDLINKMDELMDAIHYPQKCTVTRSFFREKKNNTIVRKERSDYMDMPMNEEFRGKKATFIVKVAFRQNSSWQGEVTWVDENKTQFFRSALELIRLIDSTSEAPENNDKISF